MVCGMKTVVFLSALALMMLSPASGRGSAQTRPGAPCTTATTDCTEWIPLGSGTARSLVYRSQPITTRNDRIVRALVMVHGANRNADHYFTTATGAAFLARALDDTIVISPRFASSDRNCHDELGTNEVSWTCGGDSWRSGGKAISDGTLTSFDFMDAILKRLADKKVFPNLGAIVVAGHSAGGQFVTRYEMANRVHDTLGIPISYVVANPSSYAWPDAMRPLPVDDAAPANAQLGWKEETPHTKFSYGAFDAGACANYNRWPAGLQERASGYTVGESDDQLKKQMAARPTTYLLSQVDTLPLGGFDSSCPAMAQGATRRARGEAFVKLVNEQFGAKHKVLIIPECGHNDRCVYTTDDVFPVIFPKR